MPFVIQDPPETVYVYTLVEYPLGNYFLGLHSGHDIHMSEFASAVQNMLKVPSDLPGATGRCFSMQFKTKQDLDQVTGGLTYSCFNCGAVSSTLKIRRGCEFTRYCSKRCQSMYWKKSHKEECPQISFDRRSRRVRDTHLWYGVLSGYDFELWTQLLPPQRFEICTAPDTSEV